jgi:hypothetical protein
MPSNFLFTLSKRLNAYNQIMATKQQKAFCEECSTTTNHVTSYGRAAMGDLIATVRCAEHSDPIE